MALQERIAKDKTCSSDMRMKEGREGAADRMAALAFVYNAATREARIEALGCSLWGYKLPWQAAKQVKAHLKDEFEGLRRERAQRDREEAILILTYVLNDTKRLLGFGSAKTRKVAAARIAESAIEEWVDDLCRECHGAGQLKDPITEAVILTCPVCAGHKKHRFSDDERRKALHAPREDMPHWNKGMEAAHEIIGTADRAMAQRMGRVLSKD
jgi:hypothetical protein